MGNKEPDIEILELAITREVEAHRLFAKMAERVCDPHMKQVFASLAKEELEHKARLEFELMKLGIVVPMEESPLSESAEDDEPALDMDIKDLLVLAIKKERTSLRLYIDLATLTKNKASREMLVTLAEDEAMHEARFEVEYNILSRKQPG